MIHSRYHDAFRSLTVDEVDAIILGLMPDHPDLADLEDFDGEQLLQYCISEHISQAEVVMSLRNQTTVVAISATERLIMRPIDRRTPTEIFEAERAARPRTIVAPVSARDVTTDLRIIRVLAETNPKRRGTSAHDRFAKYRDGMTVAEFLRVGGTRGDLTWDQERSFIRLDPEA